jgi:hypothetical protein
MARVCLNTRKFDAVNCRNGRELQRRQCDVRILSGWVEATAAYAAGN